MKAGCSVGSPGRRRPRSLDGETAVAAVEVEDLSERSRASAREPSGRSPLHLDRAQRSRRPQAPAPVPPRAAPAPQVVQVTPLQPPQPQVIHVQAPQQPIREIRYVDATPARTIEQDEEMEALLANQRKETQRNNVKLMEHSRVLAGLERQNSESIGTLRQLVGNIEEMQRTVQDTKNRIVLVDNSVRNFDPRMSSLEGEINRSKADLAKYFHEFHDVSRRVQGQLREMRTDVDGRPTSSQPNVELVEAICKRVVTTTVESKAAQDRTVLAEQIETSLASRMSASETEAMIEAKIVLHLNEKETMNDEVVFIQNLVHKLCKDEFSTFNESSSVEFYMDRIMGRVEAFEKVAWSGGEILLDPSMDWFKAVGGGKVDRKWLVPWLVRALVLGRALVLYLVHARHPSLCDPRRGHRAVIE